MVGSWGEREGFGAAGHGSIVVLWAASTPWAGRLALMQKASRPCVEGEQAEM